MTIGSAAIVGSPGRLVAIVCMFDRMTTAESMPTFQAARGLLQEEARLDQALARTFVGLLAK